MDLMCLQDLRFSVENLIRKFEGQRVAFFPNPGNAGDSLIAAATYEAFNRCNVSYDLIGSEADIAGRVVFLGGGGNFIPIYTSIADAIAKFHKVAATLVLLPHTIRGNEELLSNMGENCIIFCRDAASYEHVITHNTKSQVFLGHDMAFHLDARQFIDDPDARSLYEDDWKAEILRHPGLSHAISKSDGVCDFRRLDWESVSAELKSDADISEIFKYGVWPDNARKATWCFLKTISSCNEILTDRLHVGIGCFLLDIACVLRDNSYGKVGSVYRHSMRARSPHITYRPAPATGTTLRHSRI
ncbi:polysaccharide pyruvyl transferase family protein [Methylobacterium sp. ID0610]|uniref:polysaccharide pyruvyl transferase family protein n=1 Tax=Methylobacterium carpenticola TaxID=3344827 RepID=UPI0036C2873A